MSARDWFKEGFLAGLLGHSYFPYKSYRELRRMNQAAEAPRPPVAADMYFRTFLKWSSRFEKVTKTFAMEFEPSTGQAPIEPARRALREMLVIREWVNSDEAFPRGDWVVMAVAFVELQLAVDFFCDAFRAYASGDMHEGNLAYLEACEHNEKCLDEMEAAEARSR